jgi:predicted dehydrogenase
MNKINFAVVGCGYYGRKRALSIQANACARLLKVYDIDDEKSKALSIELGVTYAPSFDSIYLDPHVHAVIVAVPNAYHYETCIPLAENNKHILCEKPLSHNLETAGKLYDLVKERNIFFKCGSNFRNFPVVKKISEMVTQKKIGTIKSLHGSIGHNGEIIRNKWNYNMDIAGGGTLLDNGIHLIDFFQEIAGEFVKSEFIKKKRYESGIEYYALLKCSTIDVAKIIIESSWEKKSGYATISVDGTEGSISGEVNDDYFTLSLKGAKPSRIFLEERRKSIDLELDYFIHCIKNRIQPEPSAKRALKTLEKIFMAYGNYSNMPLNMKSLYEEINC